MRFKTVIPSTFLLAASLYILLPTADEIVIHPTFGYFLSAAFNIPFAYGVLLSIAIYRTLGAAFLLTALVIGGKPIYKKFKERIRKETKNRKEH
jgi:hypothetical protein